MNFSMGVGGDSHKRIVVVLLVLVLMSLGLHSTIQLLRLGQIAHRLMPYVYTLCAILLLWMAARSGRGHPVRITGVLGGFGCLMLAVSLHTQPWPGMLLLTNSGMLLVAVGGLLGGLQMLAEHKMQGGRPGDGRGSPRRGNR